MYLLIENQGICPVEGFTVLGLSSSLGDSNLIGQFGSGAKHGVLTCLRGGIDFEIWLGSDKLSFFTEDAVMEKGAVCVPYKRVGYDWKGVRHRLSLSLSFGALDWKTAENGLREFVSNALDAVNMSLDKIRVEMVNDISASASHTRIYLRSCPQVIRFYGELHDRFLHFSGKEKEAILPKDEAVAKGRVYNKGVFVRETAARSMFDYNLDTTIDESRNMSDAGVSYAAAKQISEVKDPTPVLEKLGSLIGSFEADFSEWLLKPVPSKYKLWIDAYDKLYPGTVLWTQYDQVAISAGSKGKQVMMVPTVWYKMLTSMGIASALDVLYKDRVGEYQVMDAGEGLVEAVTVIWERLQGAGLTNGKLIPKIRSFQTIMSGGAETQGFHKEGCIYILVGQEGNSSCILEELGHYITDSADCTRDLQDWAFKVATHFMRKPIIPCSPTSP